MLYLLLAVALCLVVPCLPYLVYRRLPRRTPPPPGAWHLERLASDFPRRGLPEAVEVCPEVDTTTTEVTRQPMPPPGGRTHSGEAAWADPEPQQGASLGTGPASMASAPLRLKIPPYSGVNALLTVLFPVMFLVVTGGWTVLFHYLGEARARSFGPAIFLFKPSSYGMQCCFPAVMLGIPSAFILLLGLTCLLLGQRRFHEYLFWEEGRTARHRRHMERALAGMSYLGLCFAVLSALWVWQVLNWYGRFSEDEIAIKRLLGVGEEVHPYDTVEQVVLTTHRSSGDQVWPGEVLHLRFRDGRTWSTDTFCFPPLNRRDRLLEFLTQKTGKPITRARLIQDVPGW